MDGVSRRRALKLLGLTVAGSLSGCTGSPNRFYNGSEDGGGRPERNPQEPDSNESNSNNQKNKNKKLKSVSAPYAKWLYLYYDIETPVRYSPPADFRKVDIKAKLDMLSSDIKELLGKDKLSTEEEKKLENKIGFSFLPFGIEPRKLGDMVEYQNGCKVFTNNPRDRSKLISDLKERGYKEKSPNASFKVFYKEEEPDKKTLRFDYRAVSENEIIVYRRSLDKTERPTDAYGVRRRRIRFGKSIVNGMIDAKNGDIKRIHEQLPHYAKLIEQLGEGIDISGFQMDTFERDQLIANKLLVRGTSLKQDGTRKHVYVFMRPRHVDEGAVKKHAANETDGSTKLDVSQKGSVVIINSTDE